MDDNGKNATKQEEKADTVSATKNWSSSLGFAPVVRKRPLAKQTQHVPSGFQQVDPATLEKASVPAPSVIISAAPVEYPDNASSSKPVPIKAPPMTLDEDDVNGFKASQAGLKAARNSRKVFYPAAFSMREILNAFLQRKKRQNAQDPSREFTAEYDPAKPNDYVRSELLFLCLLAFKQHAHLWLRMLNHLSPTIGLPINVI